jgi:hypothetical protein
MAPLPESNTARYFLKYSVNGHSHTVTVREDGTISEGDFSEAMGAFLDAMSPLLFTSSFVSLEHSVSGSNVRVPATWSGPTEWGGGGGAEQNSPLFWSFTGKDLTGRRFRLELFGRNVPENSNWRVYAIDDTSVAAGLAALHPSEGLFLTIAGFGPILNQYANQSDSQHWIGELRK